MDCDETTDFLCTFEEAEAPQEPRFFVLRSTGIAERLPEFGTFFEQPCDIVIRGFVPKGKRWRPGDTKAGSQDGRLQLGVAFKDGTSDLHAWVLRIANEWGGPNGGAIKFVVADWEASDIRVTFATRSNNSRMGRDAAHPSLRGKITMRLGDANLSGGKPTRRMLRVVRHEFGHALGLGHEHQHPKAPFVWNEDLIVQAHLGKSWGGCDQGYDTCLASVRRNITSKHPLAGTEKRTKYDGTSIMLYPLQKDWVAAGPPTANNIEISRLDLALVQALYPAL